MMKRVILFLATNILVIATISILISVLGLNNYLTRHGIDYQSLLIFCTLWGMGGAFISLFMSKYIAKMAMGVVIINPKTATRDEQYLLEMIHRLARGAGLKTMPEVGIYSSPELNAFATGPTKNDALIAVSSGLLTNMNRNEVEGVLGHEVSHIANGDMVTMTLVQGVINSFALFLSRIIAFAVSLALSRGEDKNEGISYVTYGLFSFIFDILFTLLGSILVAAYSRRREYRADTGGAKLAGKENMIAALARLQRNVEVEDDRAPSLAALKISHRPGWFDWFSSHPPLEKRIARLREMRNI